MTEQEIYKIYLMAVEANDYELSAEIFHALTFYRQSMARLSTWEDRARKSLLLARLAEYSDAEIRAALESLKGA